MAKVTFENGTVVNFEGTPTQQDIEEVALKLNIQKAPTAAPAPSQPGYLQRVGQSYQSAAQSILDLPQELDKASAEPSAFKRGQKQALAAADIPRRFASSVFAPITEAVAPIVAPAFEKLLNIPFAGKTLGQRTSETQTALPEVSQAIGTGLEIGGALVGEKPLNQIPGQVKQLGQKAATKLKSATTVTEDSINSAIRNDYSKAVKPSIAGLRNAPQIKKYYENVQKAVKDISLNKDVLPEGNTPTNLQEFADAIESNKARIWKQVETNNITVGKEGIKISLDDPAKALDAVIKNKAIQIENPSAISYAQGLQGRLQRAGKLNPSETQELISGLNARLKSFYKNPNANEASRAVIDAGVKNNITKALDNAIESVGTSNAELRGLYGSYKTIESDVAKATARFLKKSAAGLPDYSGIFSGADIVEGLLTASPAKIARGGAMNVIKNYYNYLNDPNQVIGKMFDKVSRGISGQTPTASLPALSKNPINSNSDGFIKFGADTGTAQAPKSLKSVQISDLKYPKVLGTNKAVSKLDSFIDDAINSGIITRKEALGADGGLVKFIKKYGADSVPPIVVDAKGNIIDGVHRVDAFKQLGIKKIRAIQK